MSDTENTPPIQIKDPVDWSSGDDEPSKFVTTTVVLIGDSELTLLLYEVVTPFMGLPTTPPEKWIERWNEKLPIRAKCHGRFVLTPERCESLINILRSQLGQYYRNLDARMHEMEQQQAASEDPANQAEDGVPQGEAKKAE